MHPKDIHDATIVYPLLEDCNLQIDSTSIWANTPCLQTGRKMAYYDHFTSHILENIMRTVSLADAKAHLSELLNSVEAGEEIVITRHGRAVARVSPPEKQKLALPLKRLAALRKKLPAWTEPSANLLRDLRDAE